MNTNNELRSIYTRIDLQKCSFDELQKMFCLFLERDIDDLADEVADHLFLNTDKNGELVTSVDHPPVTIADDLPGWMKRFPFNLLWKQRPK